MTEIERQKKVISMMITGHSVLSAKYSRLSSLFEITLLIASIIINALLFVDANFITRFTSINQETQKLIIGIASIAVFAISLTLLQVKWKEKAENHSKASEQLFILLQDCRNILSLTESEEKKLLCQEFDKKYNQVLNILVKIPHNQFNHLKLLHYRKIELSKLIEKHPGSRLLILKLKLLLSSFKEKK
jgi:hypothetical protein